MEEYTTMRLRVSTRDRLATHGNASQSLEDVLIVLMDAFEKKGDKYGGRKNR